jgi:hypothetical protein
MAPVVDWQKRGLALAVDGRRPWQRSHAQLPVVLDRGDGRLRVFFAGRDERSRSHVGYVDAELDGDGAMRVGEPPQEAVLAPGPLGCFDDHGVYPASVARDDAGRLLLYYIGWNPGVRHPLFYASIGLAVSDDDGATFRRHSVAPIMARSDHDPCLVTSPCVIRVGALWRMWYVSGFRWEERDGDLQSYYHVKYAESDDGISWRRDGTVCIDLQPGERNVARPCVLRGPDGWRMWYSHSADSGYRIGVADSDDGITWRRRDADAGIAPSPDGPDSDALAYPWVFRAGDRHVMLYNGNGFGREGFLLAVET